MQKPIREQKAVLIILLSNIFIAFLGIGLIIPVMPLFMNVMHLTGSTMGYLVAAFAVAQLIASPIAGRWVDRFGRKNHDSRRTVFIRIIRTDLRVGHTCLHFIFRKGAGGHQCRFYHARRYSVCRRYYDGAGKIEGDGLCICRHQHRVYHRARHRRIYCRSRRSYAVFLCGGNCIYRSDFLCLYAERAVN